MKTTREKQLWLAFNSQDQNNPNCIHDFGDFCEKHSIFNNGSFKQAKTYTQQELEEYAKQKQLELLEEIMQLTKHKSCTPMCWHYENFIKLLDKKREQLTKH